MQGAIENNVVNKSLHSHSNAFGTFHVLHGTFDKETVKTSFILDRNFILYIDNRYRNSRT